MRPFSRSVTDRVECGRSLDVDELEPEPLRQQAHRAVGERAGRVPDALAAHPRPAPRSRAGSCPGCACTGAVGVGPPGLLRVWRSPRLARRASSRCSPTSASSSSSGMRPRRPDGWQPESGVDGAALHPVQLDLEGRARGRRRRVEQVGHLARRASSRCDCSSDSRGSRRPFSISESWLPAMPDGGAELVEGESGVRPEVADALAEGGEIGHELTIAKESTILSSRSLQELLQKCSQTGRSNSSRRLHPDGNRP